MEWMTTEHVKQEAEKELLAALECSREHHNQIATAEYKELMRGMLDDKVTISEDYCALCQRVMSGESIYLRMAKNCSSCPLKAEIGCCGRFQDLNKAWVIYRKDMSLSNYKDVTKFAAKLRDRIDELIVIEKAKSKKAELRYGDHGDYGYDKQGAQCMSLVLNKALTTCSRNNVHPRVDKGLVWFVPDNIVGNIFDDLKELKEPLEEFTATCVEFRLDSKGALEIGNYMFTSESTRKIAMQIRRLIYTHEQKCKTKK